MPGFFDQLKEDLSSVFSGPNKPQRPGYNPGSNNMYGPPQTYFPLQYTAPLPMMAPPQQFMPPPQQFMPPPQQFMPPPQPIQMAPPPQPVQMMPPPPPPMMAPPAPMPMQAPIQAPMSQGPKPWHAGILVVKAPSGALVVSGIDPKSSMWSERDIKVGDVLMMVDGKEPSSLYDALFLLKGPEGSTVSVQTDGGSVTVSRDSNCSLGPASQAPPAPSSQMGGMHMGGHPQPTGMQFNAVPGQAISPQECAALGLPPGTKWAGSGVRANGDAPYPTGGSNPGESFLSI